jgi:hypothetical protein
MATGSPATDHHMTDLNDTTGLTDTTDRKDITDQNDDISLPELRTMFAEAGPRGPCPDEKILDEHGFLHTITWVRRWTTAETQPKRAWQPELDDARKALTTLKEVLPRILDVQRKLVGLPPVTYDSLAILLHLYDVIPHAMIALGPDFHRGKRSSPWQAPACVIATEAMEAWRKAGRTVFGLTADSPLVRFTAAFLSRAGIEVSHEAIAMSFQRGLIDPRSEPTTEKVEL